MGRIIALRDLRLVIERSTDDSLSAVDVSNLLVEKSLLIAALCFVGKMF